MELNPRETRCSPRCEFFRCAQSSMFHKGPNIWCRWADDECAGASCNYGQCVKGRILSNGVCGFTVKRKTTDDLEFEDELAQIKIKDKALKNLRDKDFF